MSDGGIEMVGDYPQLIKLGYDVATKEDVRNGLWEGIKNIDTEKVINFAEEEVKNKWENYTTDKEYIRNHELGRDGAKVIKFATGIGALTKGIKEVGEKFKEVKKLKGVKVWDNIKGTQPLYDINSLIYKSFEINLEGKTKVWVHGNATEHLRELELNIIKNTSKTPEAKRLATELILTDFHEALKKATKNGIKYDELIRIGRWEFKFSPPRNEDLLPALIHAQPK